MTLLVEEESSLGYYKVQTDDKKIREKLIDIRGIYPTEVTEQSQIIWVFDCEFLQPEIAIMTLNKITGARPQIGSDGVIFYDPTYLSGSNKLKYPKAQNG